MNNDRVHAYLDGTLAREALNADERQRADALEASLREAASALRAAPTPDLMARVMAQLPPLHTVPAHSRVAWLSRLVTWLWRPIDLSFRPAYGLAAFAAALIAVLLLPRMTPDSRSPIVAAADGDDPQMYVQFRIEVPGASQVALAGTFTAWQPDHQLTEVSPGIWSAMVPLDPGVHDYTFVIDGNRMVVDPYAPRVDDSFGGSNSRLFLPAPNGSA